MQAVDMMKQGSKYYPLHLYLRQSGQDEERLTLDTIESLLGASLPESARHSSAWWSNRSQGGHQSTAWMEAGYHVVDFRRDEQIVVFRKPKTVYKVERAGDIVLWDGELIRSLRNHMGLSQVDMANEIGVRQQTISEWEKGRYRPKRAMSKYLMVIAERAGFTYGQSDANSNSAK